MNTFYSNGKGGWSAKGGKGKSGKGGKGKSGNGKGGGIPLSEKVCDHCGVKGHVKSMCRKLDKEMDEWRAKNGITKGSKGGNKGSKGGGMQSPAQAAGKGAGVNGWFNQPQETAVASTAPAMPGFGGRIFELSVCPVTTVNRYAHLNNADRLDDADAEDEQEESTAASMNPGTDSEPGDDSDRLLKALGKFGKIVAAKGRLGRRIRARREKREAKRQADSHSPQYSSDVAGPLSEVPSSEVRTRQHSPDVAECVSELGRSRTSGVLGIAEEVPMPPPAIFSRARTRNCGVKNPGALSMKQAYGCAGSCGCEDGGSG